MARHEANTSNIADVVGSLPPSFSDPAGGVAMFAYAAVCLDLFATAVGSRSWSASLISVIGTGASSFAAMTTLVVSMAALLGIAYFCKRSSRWADTLKTDLRDTLPWVLQEKKPAYATAWIIALPIMAAAAFALVSAVDLFAFAGVFAATLSVAFLTVWSAWIAAAMLVGMKRDRFAIIGLLIAILIYPIVIFPFGTKLLESAPGVYSTLSYSPVVPQVTWTAAILFYVVICLRAFLALEMERDYDQIRLVVDDNEKELTNYPWTVTIHHPDKQFTRPTYLYISPNGSQIMVFAQALNSTAFTYVPLAQLPDRPFRVDKDQLRIFNLRRMASIISEPMKLTDPIAVEGFVSLDLHESKFGSRKNLSFTPNEVQQLHELFDPYILKELFRSYLADVVRSETSSLLTRLRPVEQFLSQRQTKIANAGMGGEISERKGVGLLGQNSAGALGAGKAVSEAIDEAQKAEQVHLQTVSETEAAFEALPAQIPEKWKTSILVDLEKRSEVQPGQLSACLLDFFRALGPRISLHPCPPPELLTRIKAQMEKIMGSEDAKMIGDSQGRIDRATNDQTAAAITIGGNPIFRANQDLITKLAAHTATNPAADNNERNRSTKSPDDGTAGGNERLVKAADDVNAPSQQSGRNGEDPLSNQGEAVESPLIDSPEQM